MTTIVKADTKELAADHLKALRKYAERVLLQEQVVTDDENIDKRRRMQAYMGIGRAFQLTEKEMVVFIFKGLFRRPRGCGCPTCRERRNQELATG